jgi:hypothetical protein
VRGAQVDDDAGVKIIHRVSVGADPERQHALARLPIRPHSTTRLPGDRGLHITFDVAEDDPHWPELARLVAEWGLGDIARTEFSASEIEQSDWLELTPDWHHGYPQPEDEFRYKALTYDPAGYCRGCGIAGRQIAPFRMRSEPHWGRRAILQLNWVFDEYFVRPEVVREVLEPLAVGSREVLGSRGRTLQNVLQIVVDDTVEIDVEGLPFERCMVCGTVRYLPITRGRFPHLKRSPAGHIARTTAYFGSGWSAFRPVVVSRELGKAMRDHGVTGAHCAPLEDRRSSHTRER